MLKKIVAILILLIVLTTLYVLYYDGGKDYNETKILTAHGPEDMALDLKNINQPRIIISCSKRNGENRYGKLQYLDINTSEVSDFTLVDYDDEFIRPHGIFLKDKDSTQLLYVISHEMRPEESEMEDKIIQFEVANDTLFYQKTIASSKTNGLMDRTNDLFVTDNGYVYSSNPSQPGYSPIPANVVVMRPDGTSDIVVGGLHYPNGVYVHNNDLYVATAQGNILYKYELDSRGIAINGSKEKVAQIPGGDNITRYNNQLVIAHHPKLYKFVLHSRWGFRSPSGVTTYDLYTGESEMIYGPSAKDISASSTGIIYHGSLYISQVLENFIIKVPVSDLN